ncbi:MAG: TolC family outer membrane protein [Sphingomonadales bacterium]|jgi:outer membrane protein|nr:TolC family outer membrane protein [Sphingomonadales bacterium]MBK9004938.1 TolC family outer membrane protein [Sphingomonadales bacterium]MBK9267329.1 TolC family outer membrane protein [Sphingomonadales bacterium]MBP6434684.1 TolC family outer membrane protein [Sphingorhabdus sp.]
MRSFVLATGAALALGAPAMADTLRDALAETYQTNPTLTGAREGQKAVNEAVPIAKASGRPDVLGSATYTELFPRSNGTNFTPDRVLSGQADVTVPLYLGGAVKNAVRAAENRVEAGIAGLRATESAIFSAVVGAYMDVIRDEAIVDLNRAQVGVLQVNLEATRDRFEIGDLTRTDVAQSEARLALATSSMEAARANLIRSKEIYIQLVGKAPGNLEAPPPLPNLPDSPDSAVSVALENNPDLIASKELREAARFDRKGAEASRLPQVAGFGSGSYSNNFGSIDPGALAPFDKTSTSAQVGVRATLPLYQGGQPAAQIRQAQARMGQAIEQEIAAEREAIAQTRAAYASWKASQDVIAASERAVSANELSLEGTRAENSVGNRTILDILNAEQELLNSKVQLVTARRNAYVAGFSLLAAMGRAEARDLGLEGGPLYDPVAEYDAVKDSWNDWASQPDPTTKATRTVDTPAQKAEIEPLPKY